MGETISAYAARLREKPKGCEFGATFDKRILEHIIQTIANKKMIEKAISKTWDLTRFLTEASQTEDIARQMKDMGGKNISRENASRVHSDLQYPKQQSSGSNEALIMSGLGKSTNVDIVACLESMRKEKIALSMVRNAINATN